MVVGNHKCLMISNNSISKGSFYLVRNLQWLQITIPFDALFISGKKDEIQRFVAEKQK